jgi:hypothetical protein
MYLLKYRNNKPGTFAISLVIQTAVLMLVFSLLACSSGASDSNGRVVQVFGLLPNWDVDGIVRESNAIVIGTITREIGTKEIPRSLHTVESVYVFEDYEVAVERLIYPSDAHPQEIAILTQAGVATKDDSVKVVVGEEKPNFSIGERVLLFLESLQGAEFQDSPGRPVPEGFTEQTYYQVLMSARYGKLSPAGENWKDSRSDNEITVSEIEQAVARQKER